MLRFISDSDLTERACCLDKICRPCLETSPRCLDCPNLPTIAVNLVQLEVQIQLVKEIAEEQADFYNQWDCDNIYYVIGWLVLNQPTPIKPS